MKKARTILHAIIIACGMMSSATLAWAQPAILDLVWPGEERRDIVVELYSPIGKTVPLQMTSSQDGRRVVVEVPSKELTLVRVSLRSRPVGVDVVMVGHDTTNVRINTLWRKAVYRDTSLQKAYDDYLRVRDLYSGSMPSPSKKQGAAAVLKRIDDSLRSLSIDLQWRQASAPRQVKPLYTWIAYDLYCYRSPMVKAMAVQGWKARKLTVPDDVVSAVTHHLRTAVSCNADGWQDFSYMPYTSRIRCIELLNDVERGAMKGNVAADRIVADIRRVIGDTTKHVFERTILAVNLLDSLAAVLPRTEENGRMVDGFYRTIGTQLGDMRVDALLQDRKKKLFGR